MDFFARSLRPRSRRNMRVFSIVFLVVAGLIAGVYGWFVWDQAAHGAEADATVVERVEDEDGATVYVTYTPTAGSPCARC